ncbi:MAG: serine acetyltransferase [Bacteroidota bacterium]
MTHEQFIKELLRTSHLVTLPVKTKVAGFVEALLQLLFPHFSDEIFYSEEEIEGQFRLLLRDLQSVLQPLEPQLQCQVSEVAERFSRVVPSIYEELLLDAEAILRGDPAAESVDEVISAYPGFYAIAVYRIAHEFYALGVPIFPRIITESAHQRTGIDIHPGAAVGHSFFIDHGTGIVIGETSVIGNNVKIYQGVTLGALSVDKSFASRKRHPTIENNTVIYSNATILGGETVIGHDSVIGGNVWLTESVPAYSVVYHKSEVRVRDARETHVGINFTI